MQVYPQPKKQKEHRDRNLTELVLILDRSGSMAGMEDDTIGGFNSTIAAQREQPGQVLVTTVLFDHLYEVIHDRMSIDRVPKMTSRDYSPRGCTALLDAIGRTIGDIRIRQKAVPKQQRPDKTIFVIITDGYENSSTEFSLSQVKQLIAKRQSKGWEFIFLGANMDAVAEAGKLGIHQNRAVTYLNDEIGAPLAYGAVDFAISALRRNCNVDDEWKEEVEADTANRGN